MTPVESDEIHLITIKSKRNTIEIGQGASQTTAKAENVKLKENRSPTCSKSHTKMGKEVGTAQRTEAAPQQIVTSSTPEDRQRTGRYLAVGVILVMLFIAFYHTLMRHTTVLAGLIAPAAIMLLYILWLLYFAKKRKREVAIV